jgi:hypothetical protein
MSLFTTDKFNSAWLQAKTDCLILQDASTFNIIYYFTFANQLCAQYNGLICTASGLIAVTQCFFFALFMQRYELATFRFLFLPLSASR